MSTEHEEPAVEQPEEPAAAPAAEEQAPPPAYQQQDEEEEIDLDLDLGLGKKKKKKKKKDKKAKKEAAKDPEAAAELAADDPEAAAELAAAAGAGDADAQPWDGSDRDYNYTELMDRVFKLLREKNPALSTRKKHTMPPPQLVRVGTRKTMWANFNQICQTMHRNPEHFTSFLLAELGTEGSIDGSKRLVFKGRFVPKQIESLLKKYIAEYVTCHMCRNPETTLTRDQVTRLFFLQCESCGSRRSVAPIRTGYHATSRSDRRKAKMAVR